MSVHVNHDQLANAPLYDAEQKPWLKAFNEAAKTHDDHAEEMQRQLSGNYIETPNNYATQYVQTAYGSEEEEREKKKRTSIGLMQSAGRNSFSLTVENITNYLTKSVDVDKAWMKMNEEATVEKKDMLHVKNGKRIDPSEDPEGKYLVKTVEEKAAYEDSIGGCSMYKAQDEVTVNDKGELVQKDAFEQAGLTAEAIERKEDIVAKVQSGELSPEEIPADLKTEIESRAVEEQNPAPVAEMSAQDLFASLSGPVAKTPEDPAPKAPAPAMQPMAPSF